MRIDLCALLWMGLATTALADPPSARVAVIGDADNQNLAALVTTELSTSPDIGVVERGDLAKIGDELKLEQMAGSDAVALGKLIGADGLVFIGKGPDGVHVRFTAVGLGYTLFDDQITAETDLPPLAKSIAHRIAGYAAKLKLDPAKAIPISLLNLRADYATTDSAAVERNLTLLLESRLASLPEYVVLERRHAWSLGFEHALATAPPPLLQGAYVIDGTLSLPAQATGDAAIHLRLRSPGNQQTPLEIHGPLNDLPGLVEQMTAEIQKATGSSATSAAWQPQTEAREYLLEGIWGYQHNANDAALEALDSAELLGETAPDLLAVRIPVLCKTVLTSANATHPNIFYDSDPIPDDPHPEEKIEAITRAMQDEARYESGKMESKLQILDHFHSMEGRTGELHNMVDRAASCLLAMLDHTNNPLATDVRTAIRSFANYDPLNKKLPGDWQTAIDFADDWALSKDEEIAYYRGICTTYPFADFGAWRLRWRLSPDNFCARFIPAPTDRRAAYLGFFQSLVNDPVAKQAALFYLATWADPAGKDAACRAFYDYLWDAHEDLERTKHLTYILEYAWQLEQDRRVKVADPKLVALLHYYLQNDASFTGLETKMWIPEIFPPDEAPSLLADLQAYAMRDPKASQHGAYQQMEASYANHFGNPASSGSASPPLVVSRFWYAKDAPRRLILGMGALGPAPDGLWLAGLLDGVGGTDIKPHGVLYHIVIDPTLPDSFVDSPHIDIPGGYPQKVVATAAAVYSLDLAQGTPQKTLIERYDLASQQWDAHEIPGADQLFEAGGQLYASLKGADFANREGGIARYDGKTGEITLLASSRRRPAQNPFDDRAYYRVDNIYNGPGGKPCATIEMKNYFINDQPGPWQPLTEAGLLMHARTEDTRTLLYGPGSYKNQSDAAVLVDPTKTDPELWLGPLTSLQKTNGPGSEKLPLPELPAWAKQSAWQQGAGPNVKSGDYGFRGDDLFCLVTQTREAKKVELVWYRRGQADPVHIPLNFAMKDDALKALKAVISGDSNTLQMITEPDKTPFVLSMTVVPQGICFKGLFQGFWFVPFSDIDAYFQANASVKPAAAPSNPAPSANPS